MSPTPPHLVVVGAGVIGLGHAIAALDAGFRVTVLDESARAVNASVRNFGHLCASAQAGELRELGRASQPIWQRMHEEAGLPLRRSGTMAIARTDLELELIRAFAAGDTTEDAALVDADAACRLLGRTRDSLGPEPLGALHLPHDLVTSPREGVATIATWLAQQPNAEAHFGVSVRAVETGRLLLSDGTWLQADQIIVAAGHALPRLFPADAGRMRVCRLQMARVKAPGGLRIEPAILTGTSMVRYGGFAELPEAQALREELQRTSPQLLEIDANVMLTMQPDGTLFLGDSHQIDDAEAPFLDERVQQILLDAFAELFGVPELDVTERWLGSYAVSPDQDLLVTNPLPGVLTATVTTGVGMTVGLGFAARNIAALTPSFTF